MLKSNLRPSLLVAVVVVELLSPLSLQPSLSLFPASLEPISTYLIPLLILQIFNKMSAVAI